MGFNYLQTDDRDEFLNTANREPGLNRYASTNKPADTVISAKGVGRSSMHLKEAAGNFALSVLLKL